MVVALIVPVVALVAVFVSVAGTPAADQARPNIVVIETDDQTLESMRVMDNVNSLIGDKGRRSESFVNYSLCCPSRATFLTGQYGHNHGVLGNTGPNGGLPTLRGIAGHNNLAVWLQDAGYHTALIGKYLNGYASNPPVPPGWAEWRAAASPPHSQQQKSSTRSAPTTTG